jgi:DNA-binding NarL/FixJ family response regulator
LVDDDLSAHTAVREALTTFDDRWALRSYERAGQALERIPVERPAVVLMDIWMPAMSGLECAGRLKALVPDLPVVMFTGRADASGILLSLMAGAHGYLIKPVAPAELDRALQAVLKGETPLCPRAQTLLAGHYRSLGAALTDATNLTLREREVLVCLIRHMHDKDIAEQLGISGGTVHVHVSSILGKLGVHSRAELLKKIYRLT